MLIARDTPWRRPPALYRGLSLGLAGRKRLYDEFGPDAVGAPTPRTDRVSRDKTGSSRRFELSCRSGTRFRTAKPGKEDASAAVAAFAPRRGKLDTNGDTVRPHRRAVPGDFVQCGAWRDGSFMLAVLTAARDGATVICAPPTRSKGRRRRVPQMCGPTIATGGDLGVDDHSPSWAASPEEVTPT